MRRACVCKAGCTQKLLSWREKWKGKKKVGDFTLQWKNFLIWMVWTFFYYYYYYQNSHIHRVLVIKQSHLQSRRFELWFSPVAEFLLFLFSACLFYLVSPCVSHWALKSASIFTGTVLFYTRPHPNTYTRNVKGVFEIKPCISSELKYLLTWWQVLMSFPLFATVIAIPILLMLHLKNLRFRFFLEAVCSFPCREWAAQFELSKRGQKFAPPLDFWPPKLCTLKAP